MRKNETARVCKVLVSIKPGSSSAPYFLVKNEFNIRSTSEVVLTNCSHHIVFQVSEENMDKSSEKRGQAMEAQSEGGIEFCEQACMQAGCEIVFWLLSTYFFSFFSLFVLICKLNIKKFRFSGHY